MHTCVIAPLINFENERWLTAKIFSFQCSSFWSYFKALKSPIIRNYSIVQTNRMSL